MLEPGKQRKRRNVKPVEMEFDVNQWKKLNVRYVLRYFIAKHVSITISQIRSVSNTHMYARNVTNVLRLKYVR